jgi:dCTP deaminase
MIVTRSRIERAVRESEIEIEPYSRENVAPNGYDFHLGRELVAFPRDDPDAHGEELVIPEEGIVLEPGRFYLGVTLERTASRRYAQMLFGDRSVGSLGIWVQVSAPLGHVGSRIRWTLEIRVVQPVRVYAGMKFGRILFLVNLGGIHPYGSGAFRRSGKYLENTMSRSLIERDRDEA